MSTSVGAPNSTRQPNNSSALKDAQICTNADQNEVPGSPGPAEPPHLRDLLCKRLQTGLPRVLLVEGETISVYDAMGMGSPLAARIVVSFSNSAPLVSSLIAIRKRCSWSEDILIAP